MKEMISILLCFLLVTNCTEELVESTKPEYDQIENPEPGFKPEHHESDSDADYNPSLKLNLDPVAKGERRNITIDRVWPSEHGQAAVCLWKSDKTASLSISIDDNQEQDIPFWMEKQEQYGFPFTWFLITESGTWPGWDRTVNADQYNVHDWDKFRELARRGNYIDGHDDRNWYGKEEDLKGLENPDSLKYMTRLRSTRIKIDKELTGTGNRVLTYAFPFGEGLVSAARTQYIAFRGTLGLLNKADEVNYLNVNSISAPGFYADPSKYIEPLTDASKNLFNVNYFRGWGSVHFHGLGNDAGKLSKVEEMLKYLKTKEDELWISGFTPIAQYGQERDTHTLTKGIVEDRKVSFTLTHTMNPEVFDYPLTVKIRVKDNWYDAEAVQGGKTLESKLIVHEGHKYVLVDAVPNDGEVIVKGIVDEDSAVFEPLKGSQVEVGSRSEISFAAKTTAGGKLEFACPVAPGFVKMEVLADNKGKLIVTPGIFDIGKHKVVITADNGKSRTSAEMDIEVIKGSNLIYQAALKQDAAVYYPAKWVDAANRPDIIVGGSYASNEEPMSAIFPFLLEKIPDGKQIKDIDFMVTLQTNKCIGYNINLDVLTAPRSKVNVLPNDGYAGPFQLKGTNSIGLQENLVDHSTQSGRIMLDRAGKERLKTFIASLYPKHQGEYIFLRLSPSAAQTSKFNRTTFVTSDGAETSGNSMNAPSLFITLEDINQ